MWQPRQGSSPPLALLQSLFNSLRPPAYPPVRFHPAFIRKQTELTDEIFSNPNTKESRGFQDGNLGAIIKANNYTGRVRVLG